MALIDEAKRRRWQQIVRRRRRDAIDLGQQADDQLEKLLIRRFERLISVRRFLFLWLALFVLLFFCGAVQIRALSTYYETLQPAPGGLYNEGLVGTFTNANPLYATGDADAVVSRLVFSGLFKYDNNNVLTGDLAKDWTVGQFSTHYIVHLKQGITWQDGQPFTADDVVYTYHTIQDPAAQSPLYSSWQGITVTKQGPYTVSFDLPSPLSSFPYALINGIVPQHLLKTVPDEQLRSASFNTKPVGTGPFKWKFVEVTGTTPTTQQQRISLAAFSDYSAGAPKLDGFSLLTFGDDQHMVQAFKKKQINAMSGLQSMPSELYGDKNVQTYITPLTSEVMAFFNNSKQFLNDANVRKALVSGVDRNFLVHSFTYPTYPANSPLLRNQLGYDPTVVEPPYDFTTANQILDQAGWTKNAQGMREKNGQALVIGLSTQDTPEYTDVAKFLQQQWSKVGVQVDVHYYPADELQSEIIGNHDYDILLYGINIGVDPDVFAYWDSSQASVSSQGHLNLSEYKSAAADQALEAGRTRSDPNLRIPKYKSFLTAWVGDTPALALYQPNFLYITQGPLYNFTRKADNSSTDRLYNVNQWEIRQERETTN